MPKFDSFFSNKHQWFANNISDCSIVMAWTIWLFDRNNRCTTSTSTTSITGANDFHLCVVKMAWLRRWIIWMNWFWFINFTAYNFHGVVVPLTNFLCRFWSITNNFALSDIILTVFLWLWFSSWICTDDFHLCSVPVAYFCELHKIEV